jgi:hypothetical protein
LKKLTQVHGFSNSPSLPQFASPRPNTQVANNSISPDDSRLSEQQMLQEDSEAQMTLEDKQRLYYSMTLPSAYKLTDNIKRTIFEVMDTVVVPHVKFLPKLKRVRANGEPMYPSFAKPNLTTATASPLIVTILKEANLWNEMNLKDRTFKWMLIWQLVDKRIADDRARVATYMRGAVLKGETCDECVFVIYMLISYINFLELRYKSKQGDTTSARAVQNQSLKDLSDIVTLDDEESFVDRMGCLYSSIAYRNLYRTFVHFALSATKKKGFWKRQRARVALSEMFTVHDEAFALLCLENGMPVWLRDLEREDYDETHPDQVTIIGLDGKKKEPDDKPKKLSHKYITRKQGKGWSNEGIGQFNKLLRMVKEKRNTPHYKSLESEVKGYYEKLDNVSNAMAGNSMINLSEAEEEVSEAEEEPEMGMVLFAV